MRVMGLLASFVFAAVLFVLCSCAYSEPAKEPSISFSVPFDCGDVDDRGELQARTLCLADSFQPGLNVVLVSNEANWSSKTSDPLAYEYANYEFEATRLLGVEKSLAADWDEKLSIAIVGVDTSAVRVLEPRGDRSSLSKYVEMKALRAAKRRAKEGCAFERNQLHRYVGDSPPDVFRAGNAAFLVFRYNEKLSNEYGPIVLLIQNEAFKLCGSCTYTPPLLFSVNERLYLAYWATVSCCGCGDRAFFVYDVSGAVPTLVYENSHFSN
ncbi:MAG: hypothetical protein HY912_09245 [Desulfomonile tiedjei]|uniref:Lipoprotein n=1 Tax=Desulfomonile tiedjei TaxID=2358 RepID=A0A9D6V5W1_9BACT|nr:hypothetical protein [Desulfomonile tiedjei]